MDVGPSVYEHMMGMTHRSVENSRQQLELAKRLDEKSGASEASFAAFKLGYHLAIPPENGN